MALPTLSEIRAIAVAWWREPGRRRLDELAARIAGIWLDDRASLSLSIVDIPIQGLAVVAELRVHDAAGNTIQTITRQWQPDALDRPGFDLDDVADEPGDLRSRREKAAGF